MGLGPLYLYYKIIIEIINIIINNTINLLIIENINIIINNNIMSSRHRDGRHHDGGHRRHYGGGWGWNNWIPYYDYYYPPVTTPVTLIETPVQNEDKSVDYGTIKKIITFLVVIILIIILYKLINK